MATAALLWGWGLWTGRWIERLLPEEEWHRSHIGGDTER